MRCTYKGDILDTTCAGLTLEGEVHALIGVRGHLPAI